LLPVRLFLGVTFVYAGIQKLSDPGFLHPGAPTYIGTQLHQFANGTPGGFILRLLALPAPGFAGVAVALTEIAVGLLTLAGLATRVAALVGLALNLLLFLTNSWNTYPYFLGSDIVFVFAWLPFVLTGATGQPALDHVIEHAAARRAARAPAPSRFSQPGPDPETVTRRSLLARGLGATALLTGVIGGLAALAKGSYAGGVPARTLGSASAANKAGAHHTPAARRRTAHHASGLPAGAQQLGPARRLPAGQAAYYHDPANGSPDIVVRSSNGTLAAHSAICTHAGCTVGYSGGQLVCPCHGSIFDANTGAVLQGPAVTPLPGRRVIEHNGQLYAVPT
jgi:thiosulfate dehydrogenase [quinone] large subunit